MAYAPIQLVSTPFEDYPNYWLKFYEQGTVTPLSMATDSTGGTLLAKAEISPGSGNVPIGFIRTAGDALLNPFVNAAYDLWLFPTEVEADANDTTNAIQVADNLIADAAGALEAKLKSTTIDDTTNGFNLVYYPPITGEVGVVNHQYYYGNFRRHGASTAAADNSTAISNCLASLIATTKIKKAYFDDAGTYTILSSVTKATLRDNLRVSFGEATINYDGTATTIQFGDATNNAADATPAYKGLKITGGTFTQNDDGTNRQYIKIYNNRKFKVKGVAIEKTGNGGIYIGVTCWDGKIDKCTVDDASAYTVNRGIWITGDEVVGYDSQLLDTSTLLIVDTQPRSVRRITVTNCTLDEMEYGIYGINVHDLKIDNCDITLSNTSPQRNIALNNYCPRAKVTNCNIHGFGGSATGILVTQGSHDVMITNNHFLGDYGGNRCVYVQFGAEATIKDNDFIVDVTQKIQVDNGGHAWIIGNTFKRYTTLSTVTKAIDFKSIDASDLSFGGTATYAGGLVVTGNHFHDDGVPTQVTQNQSTTGANYVGCKQIDVIDNYYYGRNTTDFNWSAGQAPFAIVINDDANKPMLYRYKDAHVLPHNDPSITNASARGNEAFVTGTDTNSQCEIDYSLGMFQVDCVAGVYTVSRLGGEQFTMAATNSGTNLQLTSRTGKAQSGAAISNIISIISQDALMAEFEVVDGSGGAPTFQIKDSAGATIDASSGTFKCNVLVGNVRQQ